MLKLQDVDADESVRVYFGEQAKLIVFPKHDLELAELLKIDVTETCKKALAGRIVRLLSEKPRCPVCQRPGYYTRQDGTCRCYKCGHTSDKAMLQTFKALVQQRG